MCLAAGEGARPSRDLIRRSCSWPWRSTVVLDGLLVSGAPVVLDEVDPPDRERRTVVIRDTTLVPGIARTTAGEPASPTRASLSSCSTRSRACASSGASWGLSSRSRARRVDRGLDRRRLVAQRRRDHGARRTVAAHRDLPVDWEAGDGTAAAGDLDITASTIVGGVRCIRLDASNTLFLATLAEADARLHPVHAERKQQGCVRYSFLPDGSRTGRRFHCAPRPDDPLAVQRASRPRFGSMRYGDYDYLRLHEGTPDRIRRGADDESEMGDTPSTLPSVRRTCASASTSTCGSAWLPTASSRHESEGDELMGADLSGARFDARKDHSGVVLQQGRLLIDGDWNELVTILERRLRANVADLDGPGPLANIQGTAAVSKVTPDAFHLTVAGGDLAIGRGRLYADGLLAENHGAEPDGAFDPILAQSVGSEHGDLRVPALSARPAGAARRWHAPRLSRRVAARGHASRRSQPIEPAIGVDTTARTQTVWQVKLFDARQGTTCGTPDDKIEGWREFTAPSGARLTVETVAVVDDDPCEPPTRRLPGPSSTRPIASRSTTRAGPGTATFKWSRDNGSVASAIVEVLEAGAKVRPASLGKDDVLASTTVGRGRRRPPRTARRAGNCAASRSTTRRARSPSRARHLPADLQLTIADAAARHLRRSADGIRSA